MITKEIATCLFAAAIMYGIVSIFVGFPLPLLLLGSLALGCYIGGYIFES